MVLLTKLMRKKWVETRRCSFRSSTCFWSCLRCLNHSFIFVWLTNLVNLSSWSYGAWRMCFYFVLYSYSSTWSLPFSTKSLACKYTTNIWITLWFTITWHSFCLHSGIRWETHSCRRFRIGRRIIITRSPVIWWWYIWFGCSGSWIKSWCSSSFWISWLRIYHNHMKK